MKTEVQQPLSHIKSSGTLFPLTCTVIYESVKHKFMLTDSLNRQFICIFQRLLYIVGTQRSQWSHHLYIFFPEHQNIGISPEHHSEVAIKTRYINIEEFHQSFSHTYRTAAGAA